MNNNNVKEMKEATVPWMLELEKQKMSKEANKNIIKESEPLWMDELAERKRQKAENEKALQKQVIDKEGKMPEWMREVKKNHPKLGDFYQ